MRVDGVDVRLVLLVLVLMLMSSGSLILPMVLVLAVWERAVFLVPIRIPRQWAGRGWRGGEEVAFMGKAAALYHEPFSIEPINQVPCTKYHTYHMPRAEYNSPYYHMYTLKISPAYLNV